MFDRRMVLTHGARVATLMVGVGLWPVAALAAWTQAVFEARNVRGQVFQTPHFFPDGTPDGIPYTAEQGQTLRRGRGRPCSASRKAPFSGAIFG